MCRLLSSCGRVLVSCCGRLLQATWDVQGLSSCGRQNYVIAVVCSSGFSQVQHINLVWVSGLLKKKAVDPVEMRQGAPLKFH